MSYLFTAKGRFSLLMWLVALHSLFVGIGLIIQIPEVMKFFGYGACKEPFFPAQGGTFHIVMSVGYALAAYDPREYKCLAIFSIFVKSAASIFLFVFYFVYENIWSVLASGIGDGLMMVFIFIAWKSYLKSLAEENKV